MKTYKVLLLPGDGIGPEVMAELEKLVAIFREAGVVNLETETKPVGGASFNAFGSPITEETLMLAHASDAVFLGAVGGPAWSDAPYALRPEAALLRLRKELSLFANLRPAICYAPLVGASSLKPEIVEGLDLLIIRELTGGVYFGEPKEIVVMENGEKRAVDTQLYATHEIDRIARVAFDMARLRQKKVASVEKHNVMRTGVLWKEIVTQVHREDYADCDLSHQLADSCCMQLVRWPKQYDIILCDNLFGDMLSDLAAMLTGSLGMLPSASLGAPDTKTGKKPALYEPVHGSAPDISGKGIANPIAMISSLGMALRYSFAEGEAADLLDKAVADALSAGYRTKDLAMDGETAVSTREMGDAVAAALTARL